ncbi:hypothetical protein EW146_g8376 [Bondarzewia mesenterica]|uniref:Uncharacterized protein n=1 Tax=Bondarzewia mesenterica TaxID=1095465 RepID=A0A4S4LEV4_9AGAM|nr:hypothetical protein EW146_g8376 [Bondarzewia mesenterica]
MTEGLTSDLDRYTNTVASTVTEGLTGDSDKEIKLLNPDLLSTTMAGKDKRSIFDSPITKGAQCDLDETLGIKSLSESAIEDPSTSQSIFPSAYSQSSLRQQPLAAVSTRGSEMFRTPLPPDPLFMTPHGCRECPLTSEEDQKLTNNLISVASKFDSTGIPKLTGAENYTDWA